MDVTLALVERFEELLQRQPGQSPYDFQTIFATGGFFVRRASQRKLTLLKQLDEHLREILWPGERVVFLTSGVLHSFLQAYFLGVAMYYLNRRALILTTERLILVQIDSRNRPRQLKSQVLLGDLTSIAATALGNTKMKVRSGKSYVFTYVPRRDRKELARLLEQTLPNATHHTESRDLDQLCPFCYRVVAGHPAACPHCGGTIKSPARAALLSLLFPGLGTIYLGHWFLGGLKAFVGLAVWISVLTPEPNEHVPLAALLVGAVFVFVILHGIAALTSWLLANRGLYPGGTPPGGGRPPEGVR